MITLITAVPGSGKTLTSIAMIEKALKEGRLVYTNINGLQKDKFANSHNLHDAPNDWQDTPDGSLVIYDECQQAHLYPANSRRGEVADPRLKAMETHRHSGHDLVFITQAPTFVHHHVRKLVGEHIHLYRGRGIGGAMRYEWSHTCDSPNDRAEQQRANSYFWKFPKEHFSYYKSATVHTHKFKIPKKMAVFLAFLVMAISALAYNVYSNKGLASLQDTRVASADSAHAPAQPRNNTPSNYPEAQLLGGCIARADNTSCMCFNQNGESLDMPNHQCLTYINKPLPRQIIL